MQAIERVGVIGAGTMGNGIAQACAVAGFDVVMIDVAARRGRARRRNHRGQPRPAAEEGQDHGRGGTTPRSRACTGRPTMPSSKARGLIVEAATESLELKLRILRQADEIAGAGTILASNTSSISITTLAAVVRAPGSHSWACTSSIRCR